MTFANCKRDNIKDGTRSFLINLIFYPSFRTLSNHRYAVERQTNRGYRSMKSSWSSFRCSAYLRCRARGRCRANFISDLRRFSMLQ